MNSGASTLKTAAAFVGLILLVPLSLTIIAGSVVTGATRSILRPRSPQPAAALRKTVLISGGKMTKALQLARSFHAVGHRVVMIESHKYWLTGHRFSRAVDSFYTIPAPGPAGYVDALVEIIKRERVDVYVPVCSPAASLWDSRAMPVLARHCEVVHVGPETIDELDDKFAFARTAKSLGLRAPKSFRVTSPADVLGFNFEAERRPYILKSIAYDSIRRLDLTRLPRDTAQETADFVHSLPISADRPWVMQEFIAGTEYCTHGTLRAGALRVHACCLSSPFQINYRHEERADIERWVRRFGAALELTGQVSMDFIEADDDGQVYAIECNPRTHSAITMFYNHPDVAAAYLGDPLGDVPIRPLASSRPTYWIYHELWRLLAALGSPRRLLERLKVIARGKDAVLDWRDPLPFLMLHHWHIPLLLLNELRERRGWLRIDLNIGKLVQPDGD